MLCSCGSGLNPDRCRDERGADIFACDSCKPDLLYRILEEKHLDIFQGWADRILFDPPPLGYEWQWEDFLKERGCEQVVGVAGVRSGDHFIIDDPNGLSLAPEHVNSQDRSVRILVPREYGESVLREGRMI